MSSLQGCLSSFSAVSHNEVPVLFIYSITSTIWCRTHNRAGLQLPIQPRRGWPHSPSLLICSGASPSRVSSLQGCLSSFSAVSHNEVPVLFIYSITSTIWCRTHNRAGLQLPIQPRRGWPHSPSLRPLLFSDSGVGSFTSHKNQISQSTVTRDLRFFVLIRKD